MRKAHYEDQDREMAWDSTSYHSYECTSTYQEGFPYGNYGEEDQYGYGERYQSWDMEYDHREAYSSPNSINEEHFNLVKLILEEQEKSLKSLRMFGTDIRAWNQDSQVAATTHEENVEIKNEFIQEAEQIVTEFDFLHGCTVDANIVPKYEDPCVDGVVVECIENIGGSLIIEEELSHKETNPKVNKDNANTLTNDNELSMHLDNAPITEDIEVLDVENCQNEDQLESSTLSEPLDQATRVTGGGVMPTPDAKTVVSKEKETCFIFPLYKPPLQFPGRFKQETKVEKAKEKQKNLNTKVFKENDENESPKVQPLNKLRGIISTNKLSINDPWKIPFEEIRVIEFRGCFYDEYDPGDPRSCHTPL